MGETVFEITNKYFDGVNTIGFTIMDGVNNSRLISVNDAIKLTRKGKIKNAKCILDILNGEYMIRIEDSIPNIYKGSNMKLTLQCRLLDSSGKCVGYKAVDSNGKRYNLSIKKTWELAFNHSVNGVRAIIIGGKKTLQSTDGFKLKDIPKIQSKE